MPFLLHEHGILPKNQDNPDVGYPYVQKAAIIRRLNRIAAGGWSTTEPRLVNDFNGMVSMTASLVIHGQSHAGLGCKGYVLVKKDGTPKSPYEQIQEQSKAYKGAASDCFPRAAVMFGIGWYLHPIAANWKNRCTTMEQLKLYLDEVERAITKARGDAESAREQLGNTGPRRLN